VVVEDRRPIGFDIMLRSLETIMITLLLDRLKVNPWRRRRSVHRLGMRTASQKESGK